MQQPATNTLLSLSALSLDDGVQARVSLDPDTIAEYAADMVAGTVFPPVVAFGDGATIWLADGFHRIHAARAAGLAAMAVELRPGNRRDAILYAVSTNATHGLRRSSGDKRRAVELLLRDAEWARWSDREIARRCMVDHKTVATVRAELSGELPQIALAERMVTRAGSTYLMQTETIGQLWLGGDEWYAPPEIIEAARTLMGAIDVDPASCDAAQAVVHARRYFTRADDGLAHPWHGRVWLNPPYSYPLVERFTQKLIAEVDAGRVTQAVVLVNNATDTSWFEALATRYPLLLTRGRLRSWRSDRTAEAPRYGQALFGVGVTVAAFAGVYAELAYAPNYSPSTIDGDADFVPPSSPRRPRG